MHKTVTTLLIAAPAALAIFATVPATQSPVLAAPKAAAGKQVFLDYKCNKCHTVASAGVKQAKSKKGREPADLSSVGAKHSRAWLGKYLQKQETIEGKKHKKKFRGDAAEEKALLDWLAALKTAKK